MNTCKTDTAETTTPSPRRLTEEEIAAHFLSPERATTRTIMALNDHHLGSDEKPEVLIKQLRERIDAMAAGDMTDVRRMLASQVITLERMAQYLFARAAYLQDLFPSQVRYMRLAMRAQAQSHRTAQLLEKMAPAKDKETAEAPPQRTQGKRHQTPHSPAPQKAPEPPEAEAKDKAVGKVAIEPIGRPLPA